MQAPTWRNTGSYDERTNRSLFGYLCRLVCGSVCIIFTVYLGVVIMMAQWQRYNPFTTCFNVDLFEAHVPDRAVRHHHRHTPLTLGEICFDHKQEIVWWNFREGFSAYYKLTEFVLRGELPFNASAPQHAPIALALGLNKQQQQRRRRKHDTDLDSSGSSSSDNDDPAANRRCQGLCGSRVIELGLLNRIVAHPTRYYLSLEGVGDEGRPHEIARHKLDQKIKSAL
jgi:hypothetical protein